MYVYSCNALSAGFFAVDRALNSYIMIMIMIILSAEYCLALLAKTDPPCSVVSLR